MIWVLIIGIIIFGSSIIALIRISDKSTSKLAKAGPLFILGMILGTILLLCWLSDDYPLPIDVYRGKTELQVTYKVQGLDTLQKDTVVVWK